MEKNLNSHNNMIESICVISPGYPEDYDPEFPFVKQLCDEFARQGLKVFVIAPQSIIHAFLHKIKPHPRFKHEKSVNGGEKFIYQPLTLSVPAKHRRINNLFWYLAVKRVIRHAKDVDAIYCHFWSSAFIAYRLFKKTKMPVFVATGESDIKYLNGRIKYDSAFKKFVKGVIAVSTKNKEESVDLDLTTAEQCEVFPNSIDNQLFHKLDKYSVREELMIPKDKFIVAFVGWFIERKGAKRLSDALNKLNDVYSIFIGEGDEEPNCKNILYKGRVPHHKVSLFLNAADVFVLPTLKEGCSNSIIEAMACGLPVISSNLPFNWDVLNENNSIMIDPMNTEEIGNSIKRLKDDVNLRNKMSESALETAKALTIDKRASNILRFIEGRL